MPVVKKLKRKYEHGGSVVKKESMENLLDTPRLPGYTDEERKAMDELIRKYNDMEAIPYEKPTVKMMNPKGKMMKPKQSKARGGLIKGASDFQGTSGYSKIESFEGHSSAKATKKKVKK